MLLMVYTPEDYKALYNEKPLPREPHLSPFGWALLFAVVVIAAVFL